MDNLEVPTIVDRDAITTTGVIGRGGVGTVYGVSSLYDEPATGLVLKQFHAPVTDPAAFARYMHTLKASCQRSSAELAGRMVNPVSVVTQNGTPVGYLATAVPDDFHIVLEGSQGQHRLFSDFALLLNGPDFEQRRLGKQIPLETKRQLLLHVAATVGMLHRVGVYINDFSPRNWLFSLHPAPASMLTDIDGFFLAGVGAVDARETPGWTTTEIFGTTETPGEQLDVFKFGLLVLRILTGSQRAVAVNDVLTVLDPADPVLALLERTLSPRARNRPAISEWSSVLEDARWPGAQTTGAAAPGTVTVADQLRILLMGTEWLPNQGGLSQFNRCLGIELARRGHTVYSTALQRSAHDDADARSYGITLVTPEVIAGYPDLHIAAKPTTDAALDIVIGHDRFTGLQALTQARHHHQGSVLIQIMHTNPEEIEWFKDAEGAAARIEQRSGLMRNIGTHADLVYAVGPRLHRWVSALLHDGFTDAGVKRLDPGLGLPPLHSPVGRSAGAERKCLMLGRAEDPELKGIDLGAAAYAALPDDMRNAGRLIIRGAARASAATLQKQITGRFDLGRGEVTVRLFDPLPETIRKDFYTAAVFMMPSRSEGYGLVGLEAIACGTPVLISSRSGLAEGLRELVPDLADNFIVETIDNMDKDCKSWSEALQRTLSSLDEQFAKTLQLWERLNGALSWARAAADIERGYHEFKAHQH